MEHLWRGWGCRKLLTWAWTRVPLGWAVCLGEVTGCGPRMAGSASWRAGVRGATGWQGSPGTSRRPTCSQGGQDADPRPTFISQPDAQPLSPALPSREWLGSKGQGPSVRTCPCGTAGPPQEDRTAEGRAHGQSSVSPATPRGWERVSTATLRADKGGPPSKGPACPRGPQTALSTGPLLGTGFWQRVSAVPFQRCHPGHSTVAMAGLPLTPVPRAPQHRSRVQLWLRAGGRRVQGPGQVPRQPCERMPPARTCLTG